MKTRGVIVVLCLVVTLGFTICEAPIGLAQNNLICSMNYERLEKPKDLLLAEENETVAVIVESSIWVSRAVQDKVIEYIADLSATGFDPILYTSSITNSSTLKNLLKNWYTVNDLVGAVLIGDLPKAYYYHGDNGGFSAETFPCDLYFTDMDGVWFDTNPKDGVFDNHTGEISPEIYLGRIDATYRDFGSRTNEYDITKLLDRCHRYRQGDLVRNHKAIMYVDDDWVDWADGTEDNWPLWLNNTYGDYTTVIDPATTSVSDWVSRLTQDYEWGHLCAHSNYDHHAFYVGEYSTNLPASYIDTIRPRFNFYNLFCCKGADFTKNDSLATTYLYSSDYSLAVIGSAKTGGMFGGAPFYNSLGQNKTIGESLRTWFGGIAILTSFYVEWFYGMVILGDPFLTNDIDTTVLAPEITSDTHPVQDKTYYSNKPTFTWTEPEDAHEIVGYYYLFDQISTTSVTAENGIELNETTLTLTKLKDGTWYLHLIAEDSLGNVGKTTNYKVVIKKTQLTLIISGVSVGSLAGIGIPVLLVVRKKRMV